MQGRRPAADARRRPRVRARVRVRRRRATRQLLHDGRGHRRRELRRLAADAHVAARYRRGHRRRGRAAGARASSTSPRRSTPARKVPWLSHLVGGFLFGFGMTLASGCGSKTLIRVGAGNLKSLVVLVVPRRRRVHDAQGRVRAVARERARSVAHRRRRSAPRRPTCRTLAGAWGWAPRRSCGCRSSSRSRSARSCSRTAISARRAS